MIKAEESIRRAQYRLVDVFRAKLADEIAPLNDLNNAIHIPLDHSYFVSNSDESMSNLLNSNQSACFIYPTGPSTISAPRTGDGVTRGKLQTTVFQVVFMFLKPAGYETYKINGYPVTPEELFYHMADRIRGAALLACYKYAVDEANIHEVEVINQFADLITVNNNQLVARAILEISVLQNIEVPMPTYAAL